MTNDLLQILKKEFFYFFYSIFTKFWCKSKIESNLKNFQIIKHFIQSFF